MRTLHKYLALAALALMPSSKALAQDVTFDLSKPTSLSGDKGTCTDGFITAKYVMEYYNHGAYLDGSMPSIYNMVITSSKPISVIEFDGYPSTNTTKTLEFTSTSGTLHMHASESSVWEGPASSFTISGASKTAYFIFTAMRVWYVGTPYGKQYVSDPTITAANGKISFATTTPGATFTYNLQLTADGKTRLSTGTASIDGPLVVNVHGEATGYEASSPVKTQVSLSDILGKQGDANGDGRLNLIDLQAIINEILKKNAK